MAQVIQRPRLRDSMGYETLVNILFVCGKARMRSPTAADLVSACDGVSSDFAGLSRDADERLSAEQVEWADVIAVMEARQKKRLSELYPSQLSGKKLVVLRVPDRFEYMDPALVALLRERLRQLPELGNWRDGAL